MNSLLVVPSSEGIEPQPASQPGRTVRPNALLRAGPALDPHTFAAIRRRAVLEGCKWDPQVGDVSTLADFPLLLRRNTWNQLASLAEQLTAETLAAELEILNQPNLINELGLPRAIRRALAGEAELARAAVRVMRFDFHLTTEGWRISEVNSDVPGGFTEASFFTALMGERFPHTWPAGNPAAIWADAIAAAAASGGVVGLLSAPGFMEDHQIIACLARQLRQRGCQTHLANPRQLAWRDGFAHLETAWFHGRLDAVVRFYQGEWLASLPARCGWSNFFRGSRTPVGNPGLAVISESKRFPLVWHRLMNPMTAWRGLLPESRDPRQAAWQTDDGWLVKSAVSNTGDEVCIRELMSRRDWRRARWDVWLHPGHWVAQRRFESVPLETPQGPMHTCLGIHTINGRAAGVYARLAKRPLVDYTAVDAAVLVTENDD